MPKEKLNTRILIVDDHPVIRSTMSEILKSEGFETTQASDGQEALEICSQNDFEVILMDIQMPKLNGVEVLKRLPDKINRTKFIFFSAYSLPKLEQEAQSLGCYAFLRKPIEIESVIDLIRERKIQPILLHLFNDDIRTATEEKLKKHGFHVISVKEHDDTLIQVRQIRFSNIIIDGDSPSVDQESIESTIKTYSPKTTIIETNSDQPFDDLLQKLSSSAI